MAVSQIEEKILGRLAQQLQPSSELNILLSSSLYRVLGLSIQLSKRLNKARQTRKLDLTRDNQSLRLYHHIIWLAREGLRMTEYDVLHNLQSNVQGPEYRVMAAKMRASMHHVLCLFDKPSTSGSPGERYKATLGVSRKYDSPTANDKSQTRSPAKRSPPDESEGIVTRRRNGKAALRDPIPSMTSDTSYVTNPYAAGVSQTPPPPPPSALVPAFDEARRTPVLPPGLTPVKEEANKATVLMSPGNDIANAARYFAQAQALADSLLAAPNAIRLSLTLEHAVFLWDCAKEPERAQKLARRAVRAVYKSSDGLDDEEFSDASALVSSLAGIVKRGQPQTSSPSSDSAVSPVQNDKRPPPMAIDRTIALSPTSIRNHNRSPAQIRSRMRTPERLSTVPEVDSVTEDSHPPALATPTPPAKPASRLPQRRTSSAASAVSDKASKRRLVEQAEQLSRQNSTQDSGGGGGGASSSGSRSRPHSRQATPPDGISVPATTSKAFSPPPPSLPRQPSSVETKSVPVRSQDSARHEPDEPSRSEITSAAKQGGVDTRTTEPSRDDSRGKSHRSASSPADERRQAIRRTLSIITSSAAKSLGSEVSAHGNVKSSVRIV